MAEIHHAWRPIEPLPPDWKTLSSPELAALRSIWSARGAEVRESAGYKLLLERVCREWAIETGILEGLYSLDRGATEILIREGLRIEFLDRTATDKSPELVMDLIRDQYEAVEGLFAFVKGQRGLSKSYVRELHQVLTRHQETTTGINGTGQKRHVGLLRGEWKKWPNSPSRPDRSVHEYCPPEQVESEMDRLISMHADHLKEGVSAEVRAAWLHHRFTEIHPFQDGNGRVSRSLASLEFLRDGWFPLVVTREMKPAYISALEAADAGDLRPVAEMFADAQIRLFNRATGPAEVAPDGKTLQAAIEAAAQTLAKRDQGLEAFARAFTVARQLQMVASDELATVVNDMNSNLKSLGRGPKAYPGGGDHAGLAKLREAEIRDIAHKLGVHPDTRVHSSACFLTLDDGARTDLVVAIHGTGSPFAGVLAATVFLKLPPGRTKGSEPWLPACLKPFLFTYEQSISDLSDRFRVWLRQALVLALEIWRRGL